jgi:hypothetical protein
MIKISNSEDRLIAELVKTNPDPRVVNALLARPELNFTYFFEMLRRHLIEAEALSALLKFSLSERIKKIAADIYTKSSVAMIGNNRLIGIEALRIINALKSGGIGSVLLKGLSLDFSGLRVCRDLDILVKQDDLLASLPLLESLGYRYVGNELNHRIREAEKEDIRIQFSWNNQYQLFNERKNLLLEIHTNLFERERVYYNNLETMLDRIDELRSRARIHAALGVPVLSGEDLLMLMCMHNAVKRNFSKNNFLLRNLVDVDRLVSNGVDWNKFLMLAGKMKISHYLYFSLRLAKEILATDIPGNVLPALRSRCGRGERFLAALHVKCFKNLKYNSPLYSFLYKILASFVYNHNGRAYGFFYMLLHLLFPPRWWMSERSGIKPGSPLLVLTYMFYPLRMFIVILRNLIKKH